MIISLFVCYMGIIILIRMYKLERPARDFVDYIYVQRTVGGSGR